MTDAMQALLVMAHTEYTQAAAAGDAGRTSYWNGYLCGIREAINAPERHGLSFDDN